jgi:hypothetical protein
VHGSSGSGELLTTFFVLSKVDVLLMRVNRRRKKKKKGK